MALHGSVGSDVIQRTCAGHAMNVYASTCPRQCLEMRGLVSANTAVLRMTVFVEYRR